MSYHQLINKNQKGSFIAKVGKNQWKTSEKQVEKKQQGKIKENPKDGHVNKLKSLLVLVY